MRYIFKNITGWRVQLLVWLGIFILSFLSYRQNDPTAQALTFSAVSTLFYIIIIYANASWLMPVYYYRKNYALYAVLLIVVLAIAVTIRTLANLYLYNTYFTKVPEPLSAKGFYFSIFSAIFILLFSYFFRLALNFFSLSKKQAEINAEKAQTELTLLKQQLHPHFLFNTLNNIYYVAGKDSPEAADLIERLSSIMRYFIEEAKKEKVFLKDEVSLLKSYIELESIRMRYEMPVQFTSTGNISNTIVPPLLLMPLVENIFKHGVDKRSQNNFAEITLAIAGNMLSFTTKNMYYPNITEVSSKTGLANLTKRLQLYYAGNYTLTAKQEGEAFITALQIPVDEH